MRTTFLTLSLAASAFAAPIPSFVQHLRREVPQEHSHEQFLTTVRASLAVNNPLGIQDPVFALLGNAAASAGQGQVTDTDCLQQETADQAFTNAKAAADVKGMTAALIYRALERNTGGVGVASVLCTSVTAANPEIAALTQHQDPASTGAAATNKAITLELAKQINSIGGDPLDALKSGTFAPGDLNDNTGKGNTCDNTDDPVGCIFTQNLLVEDATAAEIAAAVGGGAAGGGAAAATTTAAAVAATTAAAVDNGAAATSTVTVTETADCAATNVAAATTTAAAAAATTTAAAAGGGANAQAFKGALGAAAPVVSNVGGPRPFVVNGNTFVNKGAATQRSCAIQNNACANAANGSGNKAPLTVQACGQQEAACNAANA